jgi:hypothetical protein
VESIGLSKVEDFLEIPSSKSPLIKIAASLLKKKFKFYFITYCPPTVKLF